MSDVRIHNILFLRKLARRERGGSGDGTTLIVFIVWRNALTLKAKKNQQLRETRGGGVEDKVFGFHGGPKFNPFRRTRTGSLACV